MEPLKKANIEITFHKKSAEKELMEKYLGTVIDSEEKKIQFMNDAKRIALSHMTVEIV